MGPGSEVTGRLARQMGLPSRQRCHGAIFNGTATSLVSIEVAAYRAVILSATQSVMNATYTQPAQVRRAAVSGDQHDLADEPATC